MRNEATKTRTLPSGHLNRGQAKSDSPGKKTAEVVVGTGTGVGAEDGAAVGAKVGIGVGDGVGAATGAELGAGLGAWNVVVVVIDVVLVALSSKLDADAPSTSAPLKTTSSKTEAVRTMVVRLPQWSENSLQIVIQMAGT